MPQKLNSISLFSPGNCPHELLESILVGRQDLLDRLEKSVLDSIQTNAGHHHLLVGPRGTGKTHLLAILFNRINKNQAFRDRVVIAYMKEEERGVASFLDWQVRILRAFARRNESAGQLENEINLQEELTRLTQLPLDQAQIEAEHLLLKFVGDRRLLLIVENLGEIFSDKKGMKKEGQQKFRDLIQQHPFWTIMSSTQALFEDIQTRQGPFYGFFKIQHLSLFSYEQALELLEKLAATEKRDQLKTFFRSPAGQGRIRAIHEITGGNPRLLVIFYQFIDRESIEDLSKPFMEMVDNLTAYYQEQMQPLPALQQKIIEFLCERRSATTVKEIAQSCFISQQSTANQLKRLSEQRYVQSTPKGRESYYELREPLFRICFEVKENMGYPISLFIDFLGKFYSVEELRRKYKSTTLLRSLHKAQAESSEVQKLNTELMYIEQTVFKYHTEQFKTLRTETEYLENELPTLEEISTIIDDLISQDDFREATRLADAAHSYKSDEISFLYKSAIGYRKLGDTENALEKLNQLIQIDSKNVDVWIEKASIEMDNDDLKVAETCYRNVLGLDEKNVKALIGMGHIFRKWKDYNEARTFYTYATQVSPQNTRAWLHLVGIQVITEDVCGARSSFSKVIKLEPNNVNIWFLKGVFEGNQGAHKKALDCFLNASQLQPENSESWRLLGQAQKQTNDINGARSSYQKATQLNPNDVHAWIHRGKLEKSLGAHKKALDCFLNASQLQPENSESWRLLGQAQEQTNDINGARSNYQKATELNPNNVREWIFRGAFEGNQESLEMALTCFNKVIQLQPKNPEGWRLLGQAQERINDIESARNSLQKSIELDPNDADTWLIIGVTEWHQGAYETALDCFLKVSQLQPENSEGWRLLGLTQKQINDIENARDSLRKATELDPNDADAWISWGDLEREQKNLETALNILKRGESLSPASSNLNNTKGETLREMNLFAEAISHYQKAIELDSNACFPYFNLALALFQTEDFEAGLKQIAQTLDAGKNPDWAEPITICIDEINDYLITHAPLHQLPNLIEQQQQLFKNSPFSESFSLGLTGTLTDVLKQHQDIPPERLIYLNENVIPDLAQNNEFRVVCHLFDTGVRYLQTEDLRILLELPLEERSKLQELLDQEV